MENSGWKQEAEAEKKKNKKYFHKWRVREEDEMMIKGTVERSRLFFY